MKLFYVGAFLSERIFFAPYGFTKYGDVFAEASTREEAVAMAKEYFKTKFRVDVTGTRTTIADRKHARPDFVLKGGLLNQNAYL